MTRPTDKGGNAPDFDVLIVGGGIVGLSLSILLAQKGYKVCVVESRTQRSKQRRAIVLQPNGLRVIAKMRLLGELKEKYSPLTRIVTYDLKHRELITLDYGALSCEENYLLPIIPGETEELLETEAARHGVVVKKGFEFRQLLKEDGIIRGIAGVALTRVEERLFARVIVGADGTNSQVRVQSGIPFHERQYHDGYFLMLTGGTELPEETGTMYLDRNVYMGANPIDRRRTYVFQHCSERAYDVRSKGLSAFKESLTRIAPQLVDNSPLESWNDIMYLLPKAVECEHWVETGLALLGDASHAMNPSAGQGLNLGLEDALSLSETLDTAFAHNDLTRGQLRKYEANRKPVADAWIREAETLSKLLATDSRLVLWMRKRILERLAKKPELLLEVVEMSAGLREPPPSVGFRLKVLGILL